jgi:hypothetical protein
MTPEQARESHKRLRDQYATLVAGVRSLQRYVTCCNQATMGEPTAAREERARPMIVEGKCLIDSVLASILVEPGSQDVYACYREFDSHFSRQHRAILQSCDSNFPFAKLASYAGLYPMTHAIETMESAMRAHSARLDGPSA